MGISFQGDLQWVGGLSDGLGTIGYFPATSFLSRWATIKTVGGKVAIRALNAQNGGKMQIPFGLHFLESEAKLYAGNFAFFI